MKSLFLIPENERFAIICFLALKCLDANQRMDTYLYGEIVNYALYNPNIHTLSYACKTRNKSMVQYLLDQGEDIHWNGDEPLCCAVASGDLELIQYLVHQGASAQAEEVLCEAVKYGHLEIIKYLVGEGADLIADGEFVSIAVQNDNFEVVKYLVSQGVRVDDMDLIIAIRNNHFELVKYLISHGADVRALSDAPLREAIDYGYLHMVKYLVSKGASVYATGVLEAVEDCRNAEIIKYLVKHGASVYEHEFPSYSYL